MKKQSKTEPIRSPTSENFNAMNQDSGKKKKKTDKVLPSAPEEVERKKNEFITRL